MLNQIRAKVQHCGNTRPVCARSSRPTTRHQHRHAVTKAANNGTRLKLFDAVSLGNLCVDVVVPLQRLPAADPVARKQLLQELTAQQHVQSSWELGGTCNFMIAAARLGMSTGGVGHVGNDVYGQYMDQVLQAEGIAATTRLMPAEPPGTDLDRTLVCFVLVDPHGKHAFCSSYDFGPWPLLQGVNTLPPAVMQVLHSTAAVFMNGFVFDELPLKLVQAALQEASRAGAAVLFDPGPRAYTMKSGSRRHALDSVMNLSDVVLMTQEEAVEVTGLSDPQAAAEAVLSRPGARTEWCVVKLGAQGALLVTKSPKQHVYRGGAFSVDVKDTVGCGDSFAAAVVLGYTQTHYVPGTLLLANAVGAATAMGRGAGTNVARADDVLRILQQASASSTAGSTINSASAGHMSCAAQFQQQHDDVNQALSILLASLSSAKDRQLNNTSSSSLSSSGVSSSSINASIGNNSSSKRSGRFAAHAA